MATDEREGTRRVATDEREGTRRVVTPNTDTDHPLQHMYVENTKDLNKPCKEDGLQSQPGLQLRARMEYVLCFDFKKSGNFTINWTCSAAITAFTVSYSTVNLHV